MTRPYRKSIRFLSRIGSNNHNAKVDEIMVKEIREAYISNPSLTQITLAKIYGINQSSINAIINRKHWKHI